jgi:hypothetical protein
MNGISAGIYQEERSIYSVRENQEEERLFEVNDSIRNLLESLDKKQNILTEEKDEEQAQ